MTDDERGSSQEVIARDTSFLKNCNYMCYINRRTSKFVQVINESTVTLNTTNMID